MIAAHLLALLLAAPPNVVIVLADDLGAHDLGCTGSTFHETPHIDKLAQGGVRFTQAYAACTVCSPTRAALMTGHLPARLHVTDWIAGHERPFAKLRIPDWSKQLPATPETLPEALKKAGYATGLVGKWHLGDGDAHPRKRGFDEYRGDLGGSPKSYFSPYTMSDLPDGPPGEYLTDRMAAEAEGFIDRHKDGPFFLLVAPNAVHTPLAGKPAVVAKYKAKATPGAEQANAQYAAVLEALDDCVGRIVAKLDAAKLSERTLVVFTSDNGGLIPQTSNAPLRAGKGSPYEGGHRVPLIVRWAGKSEAGATNSTSVITMDVHATVRDVCDGSKARDGATLRHELKLRLPYEPGAFDPSAFGNAGVPLHRSLVWHYPHYHPGGATPYSAIIRGSHKLIVFHESDRAELYDLSHDPGESKDIAATIPRLVEMMRDELFDRLKAAGAQMPTTNPANDPARDKFKR